MFRAKRIANNTPFKTTIMHHHQSKNKIYLCQKAKVTVGGHNLQGIVTNIAMPSAAGIRAAKQIALEATKGCAIVSIFIDFAHIPIENEN